MKFKQSVLGLALAGVLTLCPAAAWAQQHPIEPYYLTPKLLYSSQSLDNFSSSGKYKGLEYNHSTGTYNGKDVSDNSWGGGLAIGYDFGVYGSAPIRLELEYLYRGQVSGKYGNKVTADTRDEFGKLANSPSSKLIESSHSMSASIHSVFANAYLDFHNDSNFTPYIGGGLGAAYVDAKTTIRQNYIMGKTGGIWNPGVPLSPPYTTEYLGGYNSHTYKGQQNSWNMAWNLGAGFAYQITDNVALDFNYRYSDFGEADFGTSGFNISGTSKNPDFDVFDPTDTDDPNITTVIGKYSGKSKVNLTAHEFIIGLRFTGY